MSHYHNPDFMVFTGNSNPVLAEQIAHYLGISLGAAQVGRFSDGEVTVEIKQNVRARDVFVVQSTCAPTNESLMELLIMVDALKRASAERISAVIPYFGYARQDRRPRSTRVPISAKVVANLLQTVGVARVLTMDLHADQIQGFFDIPVDNIYASPILLNHLNQQRHDDLLVVSPDVGGVVRARAMAKELGCDLSIIDKRRPKANVSEVMNVIGDVEGRNCVILDDMQSYIAGFLLKGSHSKGSLEVYNPVGSTIAQLNWNGNTAQLYDGNKLTYAESLNELLAQVFGTPLPTQALFAWLSGQAMQAQGWQVNLARYAQGRIEATRDWPQPVARMKIALSSN